MFSLTNTFSHYSKQIGENVTQLTIKGVLPGLIHGYSIKLTGQMHQFLMEALSCLFMSYQRSVTENTSFFVLKFEIENSILLLLLLLFYYNNKIFPDFIFGSLHEHFTV